MSLVRGLMFEFRSKNFLGHCGTRAEPGYGFLPHSRAGGSDFSLSPLKWHLPCRPYSIRVIRDQIFRHKPDAAGVITLNAEIL